MKKTIHKIIASLLCASSLPVWAIAPSQQNDPQAGNIQREIERQLPKSNPLPLPGPEKRQVEPLAPAATDVTVYVKGFRFEGVTKVSEAELLIVVSPWLNKTLNLDELNKAADAVSQFYQSKGWLAQALIPPQKIESDGLVLIKVIEAKLGAVNIQIEGESRITKEWIAKYITYKNKVGGDVSTRDIEEAIYVLNEVPGVAVVTDLSPGENDGEVALNVKAASTALITGSVTGSNYGSASTGIKQALANASLNNVFGIGDQFTLNGFETLGTNYQQVGVSIPVHESGLRVGLSSSHMNYNTIGDFSGNGGTANTFGVNLSFPLLRSQTANANLTASFDTKGYLNSLNTTGVVNSQYTVHDLVIGFSGNLYDGLLGGGVSTLSLSGTSGVFHNPLWDSTSNTNYGQYVGQRYSKLNIGLTRNQQIIPDQTVLNISVSGQLASCNLDTVERFFLGGPNGVRAYPQSQASGDQGAMINIELQQQLLQGLIGYAFYDVGWVQQYRYEDTYGLVNANYFKAPNNYKLAGYGIGAKYSYENLTVNAFYALPIGENPLYRYNGVTHLYVPENNDGRTGKYFWLQGVYRF
jgi:hemolysin activation/secretion protein